MTTTAHEHEGDGVCPNCGFCPTCGRSRPTNIPMPSWPLWPWPQPYTITWSTGGNTNTATGTS